MSTSFVLAGRQYVVEPLNLKKLRQAWPSISVIMRTPPQSTTTLLAAQQVAQETGDLSALEAVTSLNDQYDETMRYTLERSRAACELIVVAMGGSLATGEADVLEGSLTYEDALKLPKIAMDILVDSKFIQPGSAEGNGQQTPQPNPSTETSTP